MDILLPKQVQSIIGRLEAAGYCAYAVGGCVRDSVLSRDPQDWDVTTSAKPEQIRELFARTVDTGIKHGTVTVLSGREAFEVTTFRIDGAYEDARHPSKVTFTDDLKEDLRRRDFTINAMAYNEKDGLVDIYGGIDDLNAGVIRCVGDPRERFSEDALRMLRAVRFAAQLGFQIEKETLEAIRELAGTIAKVSAERIAAELVKLLVSDHPEMMRTVWECGLSDIILPEFSLLMKTPQNNPHHCYTVGEHTIQSLTHVPADKVLRLTMLFHDIAKPMCRSTDDDGIDHFYGHPAVGAKMTRQILRRLKFDNATIDAVTARVRTHDIRMPVQETALRRFLSKNGPELFPDFITVRRADILAQSDYYRKKKLEVVDGYERICRKIRTQKQALRISDLAVNGKDLLGEGVLPGAALGEILKKMLEDVLSDPDCNQKELLLARFRNGNYTV